jgi:hypothetical protein
MSAAPLRPSASRQEAAPPTGAGTIRAGAIALIGGAIAFVAVFAYLAATFDYPGVLAGVPDDVLPALLATGEAGRLAWAIYALLPLLWVPAAAGAYEALGERAPAPMRAAVQLATLAALAMMLGLMRWPSFQWELAEAWQISGMNERIMLTGVFDGLNRYLGQYVGEFLGELCANLFFALAAVGLWRHPRAPRAMAWWGFATAALGGVGLWRNVTPLVQPVADLNNVLLPLWMTGFGVWLWREAGRRALDSRVVTP